MTIFGVQPGFGSHGFGGFLVDIEADLARIRPLLDPRMATRRALVSYLTYTQGDGWTGLGMNLFWGVYNVAQVLPPTCSHASRVQKVVIFAIFDILGSRHGAVGPDSGRSWVKIVKIGV